MLILSIITGWIMLDNGKTGGTAWHELFCVFISHAFEHSTSVTFSLQEASYICVCK